MDYTGAYKALIEYKKVRMETWDPKRYITRNNSNIMNQDGYPVVMIIQHLEAKNWEIYKG